MEVFSKQGGALWTATDGGESTRPSWRRTRRFRAAAEPKRRATRRSSSCICGRWPTTDPRDGAVARTATRRPYGRRNCPCRGTFPGESAACGVSMCYRKWRGDWRFPSVPRRFRSSTPGPWWWGPLARIIMPRRGGSTEDSRGVTRCTGSSPRTDAWDGGRSLR